MQIDILIDDPRWQEPGLEHLAQRAADAVGDHLGLPADTELSILACDDARIAVLNTEFRGKAAPTNVLSWPETDLSAEEEGGTPHFSNAGAERPDEAFIGDIAIAYDTCAREAAEQRISMADHTTHLVVHGILHLLGYDHERDRDATLMEGLETVILGKLGVADPYRDN
ncbi:rRNA maturation RNase YbeY [Alisedimentitalea sp. MJ-SS2]|uniref:rRNA maturation RNase YbeY n=1 Tax=Aliisedimentitalea sp. MJ-SS2 TaxID=3049795 RepID=UPI002906632C|nr:rRNA maturation RNase YbeY [Alisedimentitalea sp. MJ-SS2]MDU8925992.1 rRNA maturation RNase YbeY [Alisedimentitalea sp. MJ-SS2]